MQIIGGTWAGWLVWGMLLGGAGLVLASLRQASERFWYWKQARQMAAGEVAPAGEALSIGQRCCVMPGEANIAQGASFMPAGKNQGMASAFESTFGEGMTGRIVGIQRGVLLLLLEPETITREEEQWQEKRCPVEVGQALTVQITGGSELFRFTAPVRSVQTDPEQPFKMQVTVKLPFWLARIQRRQHVRASIHSGVTLQTASASNTGSVSGETLRGTVRDLSGGGLCLELDTAQRPDTLARLCAQWYEGALVECRLNVPLLRENAVPLRIHSCERIVVRGGLGLRIRGEFAHMPAWQQETLINMVFQAQRQQLRQNAPRFQAAT